MVKIWAVGGGKGGVGKSLMVSNMGIYLSKIGKKVLLVDADFGAANLHTFLGMKDAVPPLSDFLKKKVTFLQRLISRTTVPHLDVISGARNALDVADLNGDKLGRLEVALRGLAYDYILLDLGPGSSFDVVNLFLMAEQGIIVIVPEPTAVENTYRLLKCIFLMRLKKKVIPYSSDEFRGLLQRLPKEGKDADLKTPVGLFRRLMDADRRQGNIMRNALEGIDVSFVVNQVRREDDREIGLFIKKACYDYFGIEMSYLGYIRSEECVYESIRSQRPLMTCYPESVPARKIERMVNQMLKQKDRCENDNSFN